MWGTRRASELQAALFGVPHADRGLHGQHASMMGHKEKKISGEEHDWTSRNWRRIICGFKRAGRGKSIKQGMSRRARRLNRLELRKELHGEDLQGNS